MRVGIDVGGTFTDVIVLDEGSGGVVLAKQPTRDSADGIRVLAALEQALPSDDLRVVTEFAHGTTLALNAIIERRGGIVGLLCTHGFRDVLEIRRGGRDDAFNLTWSPPRPLVPRRLRLPVRGRILASGEERTALHDNDVEEAVAVFAASGVEAVAIAFINAWANPAHERRAGDLLRQAGFGGEITLSSDLSREYREFERTSTASVNAYVQPLLSGYLRTLHRDLRDHGLGAEPHVMRSGGGLLRFQDAETRPVEIICSGPVAGAEAAARVARELGLDAVVAADVGGTSFDTCLILDGVVPILSQGLVAGLPVQTRWGDVRSIGAGGGSVAWLDEGGLLRVGPRSQAGYPGPAVYGCGGEEPTVTDAAALLGMIDERRRLGGMTLDFERAATAYATLAQKLERPLEVVAQGVMRIAATAMANAIREITIEQGHDPREAALVAFGGAGPLFAELLARELAITTVVVPPLAGNFSAWGLLGAEPTRDAARTYPALLCDTALKLAEGIFVELAASCTPANGRADAVVERLLDLRYRGQEHTLTVSIPHASSSARADEVASVFCRAYETRYLHTLESEIEIVTLRTRVRLPTRLPDWPRERAQAGPQPRGGAKTAFSFALDDWATFETLDRDDLQSGDRVTGPAMISEHTATTYLDSGSVAEVDSSGCLVIT